MQSVGESPASVDGRPRGGLARVRARARRVVWRLHRVIAPSSLVLPGTGPRGHCREQRGHRPPVRLARGARSQRLLPDAGSGGNRVLGLWDAAVQDACQQPRALGVPPAAPPSQAQRGWPRAHTRTRGQRCPSEVGRQGTPGPGRSQRGTFPSGCFLFGRRDRRSAWAPGPRTALLCSGLPDAEPSLEPVTRAASWRRRPQGAHPPAARRQAGAPAGLLFPAHFTARCGACAVTALCALAPLRGGPTGPREPCHSACHLPRFCPLCTIVSPSLPGAWGPRADASVAMFTLLAAPAVCELGARGALAAAAAPRGEWQLVSL